MFQLIARFLAAAVTAAVTVSISLWTLPALAADIDHGAQVFATHCAACHAGGGNVVNGAKTLQYEDLEKYDMASLAAIKNQVTQGKAAMPSFLGRLTATDIEDVATYVLNQAEQGW